MMLNDPKPCHTCGRDARYCSCDRTITAMLHEYRPIVRALREALDLVPDPVIEEARPMNRAQRRARGRL